MSNIFCILICFANGVRSGEEMKGIVVAVQDGNTLEIAIENNEKYRIVLQGIDCPELNQDYGATAKKILARLVLHKEVTFRVYGKDRNRNYIAFVLLKGETDIRIDLLQAGLAWTAEKNPLPELEIHRNQAAVKRKGLWKQDAPVPPWIFRREQSMLQPKSR